MRAKIDVTPIGLHGRFPTYQAKIGTGSSAVVIIRRVRRFSLGQRIQFANIDDLMGQCVGCASRWRTGIIWDIMDNRLYIELN